MKNQVVKQGITKEQSKDTGMAMVLLLLIFSFVFKSHGPLLIKIAIVVHVLNMIYPQLFRPLAVLWFGLAHVMGTVMSKVLLSIVFFLVVTPIGLLRRLLGYDSMKLKSFKASDESVLVVRNHTFTVKDIENPY